MKSVKNLKGKRAQISSIKDISLLHLMFVDVPCFKKDATFEKRVTQM